MPENYPDKPIMTLRRQRVAIRLHSLGARALAELLSEIGGAAWPVAEEYAERLTPEMIVAVGADRFAPVIAEVPR